MLDGCTSTFIRCLVARNNGGPGQEETAQRSSSSGGKLTWPGSGPIGRPICLITMPTFPPL
eukprot:5515236-Pyramimonas_sp.AAC.1